MIYNDDLNDTDELAAHLRDAGEVRKGLREQFLTLTHEAMRHLAKQDTFENAALFGWDEESRGEYDARWNNDTLVAAFERIIARYVAEHWGMEYEPYTEPGRGIVPPNADALAELDVLREAERSGGDGA